MPAGDLVTVPYQLELRTYLVGVGGRWQFDRERTIGGLGNVEPKTNDLPYAGRGGSYPGGDLPGFRVTTWPLWVAGEGVSEAAREADAMTRLADLRAAWAESSTPGAVGELRLYYYLPGERAYLLGRPRGVDPDLSLVHFGFIRALCTFASGLDPAIHPEP